MTKKAKVFDEDELRAKRVFSKIERASKSTYNYSKRTNKGGVKRAIVKNTPRGKEVLVKITGSSSSLQKWKAHLDYISRKGELPVYEDEYHIYKGKDELKQLVNFFNYSGASLPNDSEIVKERREVLHFVFSMKEHETTPANKLMSAVVKTIKDKYPNNASCFAFHADTDNPHVHCSLKVASYDGKRIDIRKQDLLNLRVDFAKNLNELGIEAKATRRNKYINKDLTQSKDEMKNHYYEVAEFGNAKYKFDETKKDSFFVKYKTTKGDIIDIWSEDLQRVVKENNIKVGEFAKFKIVGKKPVVVKTKRFNKKTNKWTVYTKQSLKNVWDCSVAGRLEKDLKTIPKQKQEIPKYCLEEEIKKPFVLKNRTNSKNSLLDKLKKTNNNEFER